MEDRDRMTVRNLVIFLADEFHDWIDGDDPVADYEVAGNSIIVRFESGEVFHIQISEFEE